MATQPIENIEAVLGRFQAWTGARNAVGPGAGIREIPYEEALASGRYRWKGAGANSAKKAVGKQSAVSEPPQVPAAPVKAEPDKKQRTAKLVREREHGKSCESAKGAREANARSNSRIALETKRGGGNRCVARKAPGKSLASAEPEFREALASAIFPSEIVAQPVEMTRQVAISIRLAPSERALIKTRAAEAGITASAYIRQCALEVEQLREQVRSAVAAIERGVALPASVAALVSPPAPAHGFFARIHRRFFPSRAPALALRA